MQHTDQSTDNNLLQIQTIIYIVVLVVIATIFLIYQVFNTSDEMLPWPELSKSDVVNNQFPVKYSAEADYYWEAPALSTIAGSALENQILYGKELIQNTSKYLGPNGSVMQISNGMNCQNCHLDAGTKIYGNNYGSVASTYPKIRARSGKSESIINRINDCFERSLNGLALDSSSRELQAMKAYMLFLGSNVEKNIKVKGSGLKNIPYLDRAANAENGRKVYREKCVSCHQENGEGTLAADKLAYVYPPLWGNNSYNDAAGLYRLSNMAKYIKYNMPLGATYESPQLSDEEAWDLAAFIDSQPRPHKSFEKDWPDIKKKPIDHPFGPYSDAFTEFQHKYGPFNPISAFYK